MKSKNHNVEEEGSAAEKEALAAVRKIVDLSKKGLWSEESVDVVLRTVSKAGLNVLEYVLERSRIRRQQQVVKAKCRANTSNSQSMAA